MKRQTRTELDKIVMIGMSKIDQLVNKLCDECETPQIEVEQPDPAIDINDLFEQFRIDRAAAFRSYDPFGDRPSLIGMQNSHNPFDAQRAAGQANLGMLGSVF